MTVLFIALCFETALVVIVLDVQECVHPPQMQNQTLQERCVTNGNHFLARHLGLVDFVFLPVVVFVLISFVIPAA